MSAADTNEVTESGDGEEAKNGNDAGPATTIQKAVETKSSGKKDVNENDDALWQLISERCEDDKVFVRKAAVQALESLYVSLPADTRTKAHHILQVGPGCLHLHTCPKLAK